MQVSLKHARLLQEPNLGSWHARGTKTKPPCVLLTFRDHAPKWQVRRLTTSPLKRLAMLSTAFVACEIENPASDRAPAVMPIVGRDAQGDTHDGALRKHKHSAPRIAHRNPDIRRKRETPKNAQSCWSTRSWKNPRLRIPRRCHQQAKIKVVLVADCRCRYDCLMFFANSARCICSTCLPVHVCMVHPSPEFGPLHATQTIPSTVQVPT